MSTKLKTESWLKSDQFSIYYYSPAGHILAKVTPYLVVLSDVIQLKKLFE